MERSRMRVKTSVTLEILNQGKVMDVKSTAEEKNKGIIYGAMC